ncbi:MAG: conjugal transfer protein TraX [Oscillospiraceae bacterium]|nr:conjugal transfer protein TraX [Oscillospiraceae bacterium]
MNKNTSMLKIIAIGCMIIDHAGAMLFPGAIWMRIIGRAAFPLFCWCMAVGAAHTRSLARYGGRLAALFIISQPFYMIALNHTLLQFNIFATLLLGLAGIAGIRKGWYWATVAALVAAYMLKPDYGLRGVVCILILYICQDKPIILSACFGLFCYAWGIGGSMRLAMPWGISGGRVTINWGSASLSVFNIFGHTVRLQMLALLALPLMLIPMERRTRLPIPDKLLYWAYPAHLAGLWLIKDMIK